MASVYKKFTAQDFAIIPFNAHKQYNFTSASAAANQVSQYTVNHTSESVSLYSSASSVYGSDSKNVIKYNQIDHLFYRDYKRKVGSKKDFKNYLKQRRDLYKKANIISIPTGLYGYEIKPNSFYLKANNKEVVDDSFGNLIISGTNVNDYPNDVQENVFRLDPIQGFKKYDLSVYEDYAIKKATLLTQTGQAFNPTGTNDAGVKQIALSQNYPYTFVEKSFYRQGQNNPTFSSSYSTNSNPNGIYLEDNYNKGNSNPDLFDLDDSYFFNKLIYNKVQFGTSLLGSVNNKFPTINFNSKVGSLIEVKHNESFNFDKDENFAISFFITPATASEEKRYIIAKSGTKTISPTSGSHIKEVDAEPQFPYEIYMVSQSIHFDRSDGDTIHSINAFITASNTSLRTSHVLCQNSASVMQIWFDGNLITSSNTSFKKQTRNTANLYIGAKGPHSNIDASTATLAQGKGKYLSGSLNNINIWSRAYNSTQISNISESINASPYIGNLFYRSGFATITHPTHTDILDNTGIGELEIGNDFTIGIDNNIQILQFQGSHLIYEHEYQCTVQEHEYNATTNLSAREIPSSTSHTLANFTTSSFFKPYVTTIGLYNDANELLVVGKLGQPVRMSDETDTTFVVRYDT